MFHKKFKNGSLRVCRGEGRERRVRGGDKKEGRKGEKERGREVGRKVKEEREGEKKKESIN